MKVFISWSGELSKSLADILKKWLPGVIQAAKPYYSPDDITKGSRWNTEISKELENSKIGIICLTKDNLGAPWIMFESGALSKNIEKSKLCPILFDVEPTDIQGPLVQFQAAKFSKDEIKRVVKMINNELLEGALSPEVLETVFEMWWPKLEEQIQTALKQSEKINKSKIRSDRDILEEVLNLTRISAMNKEGLLNRPNNIHPEVLEDLSSSFIGLLNTLNPNTDPNIIQMVLKMQKPLEYLFHKFGPIETEIRLRNEIESCFDQLQILTPDIMKKNMLRRKIKSNE